MSDLNIVLLMKSKLYKQTPVSDDVITKGRHDPCVGIRATPIAEAMLALTIMDHALRHRGQNADVHCETPIIKGQAE